MKIEWWGWAVRSHRLRLNSWPRASDGTTDDLLQLLLNLLPPYYYCLPLDWNPFLTIRIVSSVDLVIRLKRAGICLVGGKH